jgi:hypothetical protein
VILAVLLLRTTQTPAQQAAPLSYGIYRIPYVNGADVNVAQDHLTHTPQNRIDLKGVNGPIPIVAAAAGWVRFVVDNNTGSCNVPNVTSCSACNNYVWIEHPNGEWTKYTHFVTNSVLVNVGDWVVAGTLLGLEGDVGSTRSNNSSERAQVACNGNPSQQALIDAVNTALVASGMDSLRAFVHLHFEVGVPDDPSNPINPAGGFLNGINRVPIICGISGNIFDKGKTYEAAACDPDDCIESIALPPLIVNGNQVVVFMAKNFITTEGNPLFRIEGTASAALRAGKRIKLAPGFHAKANAYFHAWLGACNNL